MSDENKRSVASAGSVADRPLGDPEVAAEILKLRVAELEQAIRRLADQDATLSVQGGNVIVEMDATLTPEERKAAMTLISCGEQSEDVGDQHAAATIRSLLERMK